jgi:hypothetical protein
MSQIDEAIKEHAKECAIELPTKFVPWTWVVGICTVLLLAIGGASWTASAGFSSVKSMAEDALRSNDRQDKQIDALQKEWLSEIKALRRDLNK